MKVIRIALVLALAIGLAAPAHAQFRTSMRTANKQYEIHAYNLAIAAYEEALERRADDPEALAKIADCFRHLNKMEEAARYYAQAVRTSGVDKKVFLEYGHVLRALGRYDEAKQQYTRYGQEVNSMVGNQYAQSCDFAKSQISATSGFSVVPELLNTPSSDFGPTFAGQNQVVFSSARTDLASPGSFSGKSGNSLLVATIGQDRFLAIPYLLRNGYDNSANGNIGPVSYSPNGTKVFFTRNNFVDGTRQIPSGGMVLALFEATVNASGDWTDVRPFPFNGSDFSTGFACFAPDGQSIYFASDRPDGFGGFDVYVSRLVGTSWSSPENLGPVVNSPGHELTPFFDGTNLYFASDWHHGLGGLDVFRAQQENNRWTQIFHLGGAVNSPRDDYGFVYSNSNNLGYVVSNRSNGGGNEDIYRVTRSANQITLVIRNAADGLPVTNAIVDFVECGEGAYQADASGRYTFQAMQGLNCNLVVRGDGYVSTTVPISAQSSGSNQELVVNLTRINESFPGKIVDYNTRVPLRGATVRVTNRTTNTQVQAITDFNGDYYVALSPYTTYDFVITNPGYQDIVFTLPIDNGQNRNILGVIGMQVGQSGTAGTGTVQPGQTGGNTTVPGTGTTPRPGGTTGSTGGAPASGFSVQLASVAQADLNKYSGLTNLGQVYSVQDGGRYKVRLGVFESRDAAERALRGVKAKGYSDAFIVAETGGGSTSNPGTTTPPTTTTPTTPSGSSPYMVQLGAYKNTSNFDTAKAQQLGTVTSRPKAGLTAMLVTNIYTIEDARSIRSRAQALGYPGAFIVREENGQLIKVE